MARLSDIIESFIKEMLNENGGDQVQIQRNELADQFRCAPSQINYVLTTRLSIIENLYELDIITEREKEIMKIAINDRSLISIEEKNKSRADILKGMVMVILS